MDREFHVVVWGATGFTGRLVAEYLCERYGVGGEVRWAIAGRSLAKLDALKAELIRIDPRAAELTVCVGDSGNLTSLKAMAARAAVVCTAVGPYAKVGAGLVEACIESGADYVDLTGEVPFIKRMIDAHHEEAQRRGRRIVHCCGFDSIPSDIGVFVLQQAAIERFGGPLDEVALYLEKSRGGLSGGTIASLLGVLDEASDPAFRRVLLNPYSLNPSDGVRGPDGLDQQRAKWDEEAGVWTMPFIMAAINTRIVRRSNALMGYTYGQGFAYREVMSRPQGARGFWQAQIFSLGLGIAMALAFVKPIRDLLQNVLPSPGEGPSRDERENGLFRVRLIGRKAGHGRLEALVKGKRDPGYGATSRMLAEAALCLAFDRDGLPSRFGILTPASAMGAALAARLPKADVTITVEG